MAINVPLNAQLQNATQLQQQIQNAVNSVRINLGGQNGARALSSLSQPLGRLTGQADEFTKSLDAANARVLAFGASVGVVNAVTSAFKSLVSSTIEVEKAITAISIVGDKFTGKTKELGQGLFKIAKETGQSFSEVSKAALEFSRQGLLLEDTLSRTQDALILTRLTGLDAAKSVDGLTAAFNAFSKAGLTTTQIVNKLAAVDQAFAVSSADLIEGFNRSAAVAQNAGVTFDELAGIITALQQETSRGGAVIGNALKTIFTRLQDTSTLNRLSDLGIAVKDLQNNLLPARQILQNLATDVEGLGQITKAGIFKDVAGAFQINQLISLVGDLNKENSTAAKATLESAGATNQAYIANEKLNQSLDAVLNKVANTGKQLGSILGELGLTDNLQSLLDGINSFLEGASSLLQGDDLGSKFAKGFVKGIGAILSGPGLGIFLAIVGKLSLDLAKFGTQSLKAFFGIGKAAADQKLVQESIVQTLIRNQSVASAILNTQGGQNTQALKFLGLLNQQAAAMRDIQDLAGGIASTVYSKGYRATPGGLQRKAAGGYLPAQEASDVSRGVGGASPSSKVVSIPNFAFGGGKRGTMIANTSEYIVPNYAGGGSAIFNQDMVKSMGLPAGAKKISAAGGFVPNFADEGPKDVSGKYALIINKQIAKKQGKFDYYNPQDKKTYSYLANVYGINEQEIKKRNKNFNTETYDEEFSSEALVKKYRSLALQDASNYSSTVVGSPISPITVQKLSNAGTIASLVGTIFESSIAAAIEDPQLIQAQLNRDPNAPFDFVGTPRLNEFFGIDPNLPYVEAKYDESPDTKKSFAGKIFKAESGITKGLKETLARSKISVEERDALKTQAINARLGEANLTKDQREARNLLLNNLINKGYIARKDSSAAQSKEALSFLGISKEERSASGYIPNFADLDGDGIVTQEDGFYKRLKSAAKKYSKNPLVDFALNQVLQSMLGLPEGIEVTEIIRACDKSLKAMQPEMELNEILRKQKAAKQQQKRRDFLTTWQGSSGYVPNFAAAALQQAIAREKSAGLSNSQIYVDQDSSLKSSMNPMGLMVANRRDEPAGGFQGIARARKEGMNPKLYGAASGFVPNYAVNAGSGVSQSNLQKFNVELAKLIQEIQNGTKAFDVAEREIKTFAQGLKTSKGNIIRSTQQNYLVTQGSQQLQSAYQARQQAASTPPAPPAPPESPRSAGDALAKVFALQSASVGLSALFDTVAEGSEFANNFRKFDGALTGIVSASILLNANLGGLGIALAAITGGFNIVKSLWPNAIQQMSEAFGGLSEAGQRASQSLNQFGENVNRGGISADEALAQSIKKAEEAQLRAEASSKGVNLQTSEGKQKTPEQLARDLLVNQTTTSFKSIGLNLPNGQKTGAQRKPGIGDKIRSVLSGGDDPISPEDFAGVQEFKSLADFNEETRNILIGSFADTVISLNKTGLVALGKVLQQTDKDFKPKDFENLTKKDQVAEYRSALLAQIFKGKEVQKIVNKAIAESTKDGKFDERALQTELDKTELSSISADLAKFVKDLIPSVEAGKLENQIQIRLDDFLLSYQNFSNEINRGVGATTALFEGALSSQAFSSLSVGRQSQLKTQLDRFKFTTASQKSERDIAGEARVLASNQAKNLAATQGNIDLQNRLDKFATTFSNLDNLESELNSFAKEVTLAGKESDAFKQQVADLINKNKDFQSSREVEKTLLNFSIQERENELAAIQTFYQGLSEFDKGIREKEGELRKLDFEKTLADQTAQFEKEFAQITSSSPQELRARTRGVENTKVREELRISGKQSEIQAKIERDRALNTLENITALNKNTIALEELLKQITVENLTKELESIKNKEYVDDFGEVFSGSTDQELARAEAIKIQLKALNNPLASNATATKNPLSYLNTIKSPRDIETALSGIVNEQEKAKYRQIFETYFDRMQQVGDEEARRLALLENGNNQEDTLNRIRDSYIDDISQELTSLRQSQTSPKTMGQYAATERQIKIAQKKEQLKDQPEKLREYLSSFGNGFDEAMGKIEERTLDFRNQLGKEIPDLFASNLAQGLNDAISGAKDLKTALTDAATSFFQEISRKNISNLADMFTKGTGNFIQSLFKPSIPKALPVNEFASGGFIKGGSGTKDDVPAMLMGGEYVVKKSAVNKYGKGFLDALNNGKMRGYATGGLVDPETFPTQTGRGGFFTPGDYGQGAITGKNELLTFASQSFTGGQYDYMGGFGMGGASVSLEPESARLSAFGRENSPMFERVQQSKDEAFKVYLEGLQKEKEYAELLDQIAKDKKARKKQLQSAIISAVASTALSYTGSAMKAGALNAKAAGGSAFKGAFVGSGGQGGAFNMFRGTGTQLSDAAKLASGNNSLWNDFTQIYPQYKNAKSTTYTFSGGAYRASGGLISGGSNIRDDVPAMLTGGEFVLNNRATQRIGVQNLNQLNNGQSVGGEGASAEMTQALISKLDELIQATQNSSSENVVVNVSSNESDGQNQQNPAGAEKELHKKIRQAVLDVIAQEKRLGGSLEKSR
jgi:TP901 family phage tail tape measure protein